MVTYGQAEKFATYVLEDTNIIGILSIEDDTGAGNNRWYEVPSLGQDTVFVEENNVGADADKVPNVIKLQKVPKRFVTRLDSTGRLTIQFGSGLGESDDSVVFPNPANVGMGTSQGITRLDTAYDPSNFMYSQAYGLAPSNTTLTIKYLVGGGIAANVPANSLTQLSTTANSIDGENTYLSTLAVNNTEPARK